MQIPSIPMPVINTAVPQDLTAKAVPNIQAVQPLIKHAVDPAPKGEKSNHSRSNKDRGEGGEESHSENGDDEKDEKSDRGSSVNISV